MKIFISGDIHWESRLDQVLKDFPNTDLRIHFQEKNYGAGLHGVSVIFMCQDPSLGLKQRIKLSKKERNLHTDIMLDLPTMKAASPGERKREVAQRLWDEVPEVLSRYKIPDFDKERFVADFREWIDGLGWK